MLHLLFCVHLEVSGLRFGGYLPRCPEFSDYRWIYKHQRFMVWSQRGQDKILRGNERERQFVRMERQERIHKKEKTRVFFQVSVSRVMERSLSTALASGVKLLQHKSFGQVKIDFKNWIQWWEHMNVPPLLLGSGTQTQCHMNAGFVTFPRPHSKGFLWVLQISTLYTTWKQ